MHKYLSVTYEAFEIAIVQQAGSKRLFLSAIQDRLSPGANAAPFFAAVYNVVRSEIGSDLTATDYDCDGSCAAMAYLLKRSLKGVVDQLKSSGDLSTSNGLTSFPAHASWMSKFSNRTSRPTFLRGAL